MPRPTKNANILNRPSKKQNDAAKAKNYDTGMKEVRREAANAKLQRPYVGKGDGKPTGSSGPRNINKFK
jgi:hypothetical protein